MKNILITFFCFLLFTSFGFTDNNFETRGKPGTAKSSKSKKSSRFSINKQMLNKNYQNEIVSAQLFNKKIIEKDKKNQTRGLLGGGDRSSEIYKNYSPSIALVMSKEGDKWYDGTGSLIDKCGLVLTNWHVVENADKVNIIFKPEAGVELKDAPYYSAKVLSSNKNLDLALLQISNPPKNLKIIPIGTSKFANVGSKVHAIGHPNGLYWSYTQGYISQVRKKFKWKYDGSQHTADVIQTQTPINPGNSGGPLFDDNGKMVGVNSFGDTDGQNLNFAIAIDHVKKILKPCKKTKVSKNNLVQKKDKYIEHDHNKNGVIDTWYYDSDNNGKIDTAYVDDDENGEIEAVLVDDNENGKWDYSFFDDKEKNLSTIYFDTDEDGKIDKIGIDYGIDGTIDKWEKV